MLYKTCNYIRSVFYLSTMLQSFWNRASESYACFRDNQTWSWHQKNLFSTLWHLNKNFICHIVGAMPLAHFHIVTHSNAASFSRIVILCETTFSVAENIDFGTKLMPYSESSTKVKLRSRQTVFKILLMSAVICV